MMKSFKSPSPSLFASMLRPLQLCAALLLLQLLCATTGADANGGAPPELERALREGLQHFRGQCREQQRLLPRLLRNVAAGAVHASSVAYTAARPPYEQIETLANSFPDQDADIDARPYAFRLGEDDAQFRGFHLLERAIFRDLRVDGMEPVALRLNRTVNVLCKLLDEGDEERFSVRKSLEGMQALAFEIPAKKLASEEETWSDLTLMIVRNNYRGIWSQVEPMLRTPYVTTKARQMLRKYYGEIRDAYDAIDTKSQFFSRLGDARKYSSVGVAQRDQLLQLGYSFATALETVHEQVLAALTDDGGDGDDEDTEDDMDQVDNARYTTQVKMGLRTYVKQCAMQKTGLANLIAALKLGDVKRSKKMYAAARPPYEQIETLAGDFATLDGFIDQRPYALDRGEVDRGWRGFHQVERALFRDADVRVALSASRRLQGDVVTLCAELERGVAGGGSFSAARSFDGMVTLAYEVAAKKISSEEETWSDLSIMIFRENVKGIWAVFRPFHNVLPRLVYERVRAAIMDIRNFIVMIDAGNNYDSGVNFVLYSKVPVWQRKVLSDRFYRLGRALRKAKASLKKL